MDIDIDQNFVCFLSGLLMALGANMAPKSFQNGARWGVESAPCFRAWRGLGGVLGPLGAQELILVDFWLILDGFW